VVAQGERAVGAVSPVAWHVPTRPTQCGVQVSFPRRQAVCSPDDTSILYSRIYVVHPCDEAVLDVPPGPTLGPRCELKNRLPTRF
jgi:hypothetical protein